MFRVGARKDLRIAFTASTKMTPPKYPKARKSRKWGNRRPVLYFTSFSIQLLLLERTATCPHNYTLYGSKCGRIACISRVIVFAKAGSSTEVRVHSDYQAEVAPNFCDLSYVWM